MFMPKMQSETTKRVILDVDPGVDDYLAILIFLDAEKKGLVKIEAIICTKGNTTMNYVVKNVVRLLEIVERTDIPVYRGSIDQLILQNEPYKTFCGKDGFGDLIYEREPNTDIVDKTPAAVAIHDLLLLYPRKITFICLGPLTNIALAIKLFNNVIDNIKEMWIMGGTWKGIGNVTPAAEFNFYVDPEAVAIVLENIKCPIYMLPWEPCIEAGITREWFNTEVGKSQNPAVQLLMKAEKSCHSGEIWKPADAYLAAAFIYPEECILKQQKYQMNIELHGHTTRGQVVIDHISSSQNEKANVMIIQEIHKENFQKWLLNCVLQCTTDDQLIC